MNALAARTRRGLSFDLSLQGRGWVGHLSWLGVAVGLVLIACARDAADMVAIWWNVSTYNHALFVPAIIVWLVAQRREELALLEPRVWMPGAALTFMAGLLWMVGDAAGIGLLRHAALIVALQSLVPTLLGPTIARGLMFPLFYMIFMIPMGEELVPALQTLTAQMSMIFLGWVGIPAHLEGIFITIPNGYFEVAEACSGVKFLVAMLAYGALVANVCFKSWPRRIAFMAVAVVVPVIANGLRAFGTIYMAHLTDASAAIGFDHVLYGWFFFAIVMALVMAIGWRFFDRKPGDPWLAGLEDRGPATTRNIGRAAASALLALALPLGWAALAGQAGRQSLPHDIGAPQVAGWTAQPYAGAWIPRFAGADRLRIFSYTNGTDDRIDLAVALYGWQEEGRELVGFGQGAAGLDDDDWEWSADAAPVAGGRAERLAGPGRVSREVVSFYVLDGRSTGSASAVKLATLKARLSGADQSAAALLVSAEARPSHPSRRTIDAFLRDFGSPADRAAGLIAQAKGR